MYIIDSETSRRLLLVYTCSLSKCTTHAEIPNFLFCLCLFFHLSIRSFVEIHRLENECFIFSGLINVRTK